VSHLCLWFHHVETFEGRISYRFFPCGSGAAGAPWQRLPTDVLLLLRQVVGARPAVEPRPLDPGVVGSNPPPARQSLRRAVFPSMTFLSAP
jgi:hypothetical protein